MSLMNSIEDFITSVSRHTVSNSMPDYCDLRTIVNLTESDHNFRPDMQVPFIAVTEAGHYASTFEVQGGFCEMDEDAPANDHFSLDGFINRVATAMTTDFKSPGHKISMVIENDPKQGKEELKRLIAHQFRSIARTGVAMKDILDEKIKKIAPWVSRERVWLTCWTSRETLSPQELKGDTQRIAKIIEKAPKTQYGQMPIYSELAGLKIRHDAFLDMIQTSLLDGGDGQLLNLINVHQLGHEIRRQVDRVGTDDAYRPLLASDRVRPHGKCNREDASPLLAPWLNFQLMGQDADAENNFIKVNGMWHAPLSVTMAPQQLLTFAQLKARIPRSVPYRIRFDVMPGALKSLSGKNFILTYTAFAPPLRPIWDAIEELKKRNQTEPACVVTIVASTWGETKEEATRNLTLLTKAIQGWGVCEVTSTFGNPYRAWASTLLAARTGGGPHNLYLPLKDALSLLPLSRPASAWSDDASIIFPTPDGKIIPVGLATSKQNKHTEVIVGEPGSGKSLLMNALSNAVVCNAQQKLPFIAVVDKGYSAQGQIQLIRDSLPPGRKDEAIGWALRNHSDHCRNMFDIQLGARYPIAPELTWMKSLLTAMCIDSNTGFPPNSRDIDALLERIISMAYRDRDETNPNKFSDGASPAITQALKESGLWAKHDAEWWDECPWYDVRDLLFSAGYVKEAQLAQFLAVPELSDMSEYLNSAEIKASFGKVTRDNSQELLTDYVARVIGQACNSYKMLAGRTRFIINPNTRIIAIDLNNVVGDKSAEGQLRTGIMYLFAGQISGGDFILPQYRKELLEAVPEMYRAMHQEKIDQLDQEVKSKYYDELHNAKDIPFIFPMLETQDREQRKFGIRTVLCSQYLTDMPESILKSANSVYVMHCRPEDEQALKDHYQVPEVTIRKFMQIPKGPAADGSGTSFLAVYRTKAGRIAHILKNTVGPKELWALSSSPGDTNLRDYLYEELDGPTARDILAEKFENGSAQRVIEFRRKQAGERDPSNVSRRLAQELIDNRGYRL
ncbi:conjugal transfer protein [Serratia ficaria]|uniref:conjugal transfer protein n=1 Tax=Serratia ficaria TaxID=61651 RepID=UPI00077C3000|nr:conjugal transfer protein [Serratia ficaria]